MNSIRLDSPAHGIVIKTAHKSLQKVRECRGVGVGDVGGSRSYGGLEGVWGVGDPGVKWHGGPSV